MARQNLNLGSLANDGTGDTLRAAGQKINQNFAELYETLSGDSGQVATGVSLTNTGVAFEGTSINGTKTTLTVTNPTAARTVTIPDVTGNVVVDVATQTLTNKTLTSPSIALPSIKDDNSSHSYNIIPGALTSNVNLNIPSLSDSDTFVTLGSTQILTNKTLTDAVLSAPSIQTSIEDANGNELIKVVATSSAVNEFTIANSATGSSPALSVTGTDSDVNMALTAKGTGSVQISKVSLTPSAAMTLPGAASASASYVIANRATALAISLADGTTAGEVKVFTNKGAGVATITPANFAQGTTVALDQYDAATLVWDGINWYVSGHYGATVA